jgi:aminocarboxymuconate-semialdehyde decarboxylase
LAWASSCSACRSISSGFIAPHAKLQEPSSLTEINQTAVIIDVHNHYYPPEFIAAIRKGPSKYAVETDQDGNPVLVSPGDKNFVVPGHRDIEYREKVIAEAGIDMQVITLTAPGSTMEEPKQSAYFASLVNDCLAKIKSERSRHFTSLATLPLNDPEATVKEFDRAMSLGFAGVMVYASVNGMALHQPRYFPLWERANEVSAVVHIHPNYPAGVEAMQEYWLMPLVGFMFDTTLAAAGLVFAGIPKRYPRIQWILGHLGGAIPYLAERLDRGFEAYPECRVHIDRHPSDYLKAFYYDTVNFDTRALGLATEFAGSSQLLAGSDYPHLISSMSKMKESIGALPISAAEQSMILGGNAARLYGIPQD